MPSVPPSNPRGPGGSWNTVRVRETTVRGSLADRQVPTVGKRTAHHGPYFARGRCLHISEWPDVAPARGDLVYCRQCVGYTEVVAVYQVRGRANLRVCGQRDQRAGEAELYCTEFAAGHGPAHRDGFLGKEWPASDAA